MQLAESQQTQTRKGKQWPTLLFSAGFAEVIRIDSKVVCICGGGYWLVVVVVEGGGKWRHLYKHELVGIWESIKIGLHLCHSLIGIKLS